MVAKNGDPKMRDPFGRLGKLFGGGRHTRCTWLGLGVRLIRVVFVLLRSFDTSSDFGFGGFDLPSDDLEPSFIEWFVLMGVLFLELENLFLELGLDF